MPVWTVPRIWEGGTAYILGGGPSIPRQFGVPEDVIKSVMTGAVQPDAYSSYFTPIHDKHVIGVNNAFKIGNWIDALFFGDSGWYVQYRLTLATLPILKITCCDRFAGKPEKECAGIRYLARDKKKVFGISSDPTKVCWNNNSGAAAVSLAAHFGVKRIVLLGFDMTLDSAKVSHWFGSYNRKSKRPVVPPFARHLKGFDAIANDAIQMGIEILNASPDSAITQFQKVNVLSLLQEESNHESSSPQELQQCAS